MASIKINNLQPAGAELFDDSESFLNELKSQELDIISGGSLDIISAGSFTITPTLPVTVTRSEDAF